ncbi:MAG: hypothetical protein JW990_17490, partial [Thermoleophilia bacterium]|nr:hypothetical protein [Thermoleophilia bacterium]
MVIFLSRRQQVKPALFDLLSPERFPQVAAQTVLPGRPGKPLPVPSGLHLHLADALAAQGITRL